VKSAAKPRSGKTTREPKAGDGLGKVLANFLHYAPKSLLRG
jgi:hypothetical protein